MEKPELEAFLSETRIAKLATLNADGSPNVVPVWFEWTGEVARVFTSRTSPKVKRIQRDPRVALSVEEPLGVTERWATIEGVATIEEEGGVELARRLAERYYTPERVAEVWPSWEKNPNWVVLVITPRRIRNG